MPVPYLEGIHRLLLYRRLTVDDLVHKVQVLTRMLNDRGQADSMRVEQFLFQIAHQLLNDAFLQSRPGDLWKNHILRLLIEDENIFSLGAERSGQNLDYALLDVARGDLRIIADLFKLDLLKMSSELGFEFPYPLRCSAVRSRSGPVFEQQLGQDWQQLYDLLDRGDTGQLLESLCDFYHRTGCGLLARFAAFRWDGALAGITAPDPVRLNDLVGYDYQKGLLLANTEAFLNGRMANNVLLHGEKGTGKSSSIKALLNEFASRGLRMVELPKHQLAELGSVIKTLKDRGLHFIIFIDDLSFEDFEIDYKYIKACIEGSLEVRPDNVLLYVTTNRRNLIKEYFQDRRAASDEVHVSDTYQEKTSFADRFGLSISYYSPDKEEYLKIVDTLAGRAGIEISGEELRRQAMQWAVARNGWSGRVARQFIYSLEGV